MQNQTKVFLFICSIFCLLLLPVKEVGASELKDENKGKLNLEINRIGETNTSDESSSIETEHEKRLPELFKTETTETINHLDEEMKEDIDELEESVLLMTDLTDTTLSDTKDALFTPSYEAPKTSTDDLEEAEEKSISKGLLFGLMGVLSLLCVGIYTLMIRFSA